MENEEERSVTVDFTHHGFASRKSIRRLCRYLYWLAAVWMLFPVALSITAVLGWGKGNNGFLAADILGVVGFAFTLGAFLVNYALCRCPSCDKFIDRLYKNVCPQCGARLAPSAN